MNKLFVALQVAFILNANLSLIYASDGGYTSIAKIEDHHLISDVSCDKTNNHSNFSSENISDVSPSDKKMDIVKQGKRCSVIIIPEHYKAVDEFAAKELQYHIRRATGCELEIIKENEKKNSSLGCIYIGNCEATQQNGIKVLELPANAYSIKITDKTMYLAGHDSEESPLELTTNTGTLFAVYELLETQLGVTWLWPGELGEVIPAAQNITLFQCNLTGKPKLAHNRWRQSFTSVAGRSSVQNRDRYALDEKIWLKRQRFAVSTNMDIHHAFIDYWKRLGNDHQEIFNLLPDGTRQPEPPDDGVHIGMCVSQKNLWKQIVSDKKNNIFPQNQPWIDASENDTPGKCTCESCMAWDVPDPDIEIPWDKRSEKVKEAYLNKEPNWPRFLGRLSDRYARFYLEVQKEAEKEDPQSVVMGLAYENYCKPPLKTKLNRRIVIAIVPDLYFPWTEKRIDAFRKQWEGWAETGASLMLRPNYTLTGHCFPIFYADKLGRDIAFASKRNLIGTDFDALIGQWGAQGPNMYMLARMINHPAWSVERILSEYFSAFGAAESQIRKYFEHWKKVSDAVTDEFYSQLNGGYHFYPEAGKIYTPKVMEKGFFILSEAKKAASKDQIASQRVAFLQKGLWNAQLTIQVQAAFEQYQNNGNLDDYQKSLNVLDSFRRTCETDNISNFSVLYFHESCRWSRNLQIPKAGQILPRLWKFSFDRQETGDSLGWWKDEYEDSPWSSISITNFWTESLIGKAWKAENRSDYQGAAWYRTSYSVKPSSSSQKYFLVFGAVHGICKIWVNGKLALDRPYEGPSDSFLRGSFRVDITPYIRFDKPNNIAVRAVFTDGAGGIWKPVWFTDVEDSN